MDDDSAYIVALYESLGYVETERESLPDRVILHMSKQLDAGDKG